MKHNIKGLFFKRLLDTVGGTEEKWNEARAYFKTLRKYTRAIAGMTLDDYGTFFNAEYSGILEFIEYAKCPKCGSAIGIEQVNHDPSMMVGGDDRWRVYCSQYGRCDYEDYTNVLNPPIYSDDEEPPLPVSKPKKRRRKICGGCRGSK